MTELERIREVVAAAGEFAHGGDVDAAFIEGDEVELRADRAAATQKGGAA